MSRTQSTSAETDTMPNSSSCETQASTAGVGGRAWKQHEEAYLLRSRLQKMPYKHVAAQLNKTELACRLHYHQLSHASNKRKRAASSSPGYDVSPLLASSTMAVSPMHDRVCRSISPLPTYNSYTSCSPSKDVLLPSIVQHQFPLYGPALLPKPPTMEACNRQTQPRPASNYYEYGAVLEPSPKQHLLPAVTPRPYMERASVSFPSKSTHAPDHVDLARLHSIYASHRDEFWDCIAQEYGHNIGGGTLEKAWKNERCCSPGIALLSSPLQTHLSNGNSTAARDRTSISAILS